MEKRKVKTYTEDFRQSAAKQAVESELPLSVTADNLGVHKTTLYGWVQLYYPKGKSAEQDIYAELKQLKKEIKRVKMERDILKKATAYFAKETK